MFALLAYTLIDEFRNLSWIQRVLNLLILSVKAAKHAHTHARADTQTFGCPGTHVPVGWLHPLSSNNVFMICPKEKNMDLLSQQSWGG